MVIPATALIIVLAIMIGELILSRRNEHALRARGALEPKADVYRILAVVYPGTFVLMAIEGVYAGRPSGSVLAIGVAILAAAKLLKFWAMHSLGPRWSYRVLVIPGAPLVATGAYAWLRHPNYVGVFGEITGFAFIVNAPFAGVVSLVTFGMLVRKRIALEEKALRVASRVPVSSTSD